MTMITGTFGNREDAEKVISILESHGIKASQISLVLSDKTRLQIFNDNVSNEERVESSVKNAGNGAVIGGALGAVVAGLTAIGTLTVPGFGVIASGPIVAILSGAGAGAATGTLAGALVGAGLPDDEANEYEMQFKKGKILLTVHTDDATKTVSAMDILKPYNKAA